MSTKSLLVVLLVASIVLNIYFVFRSVDSGVTMTHQSDALSWRIDQLNTMQALTLGTLKGEQQTSLVAIADSLELPHKIEDETELWIGAVLFKFSDGGLVSIDVQ